MDMEFLNALNVLGLSWQSCLCNIAWTSVSLIPEWQTGVVVPLFKKEDMSMCSNYRGITLFSLHGMVYARVQESPSVSGNSDSRGIMHILSRS